MTKAAFVNGSGASSPPAEAFYTPRDPKYSGLKDWSACVLQATLI